MLKRKEKGKMKGKTLLCLALVTLMLLGVFMVVPVWAPSTTIGVEPQSIIDLGLGPGSWFTVNVAIRNVENLVGIEYKLGYDTNVLTATSIEYGGIFGDVYIPYVANIYDADGYLYHALMEFPEDAPFTGDYGLVAIINFTVDSVGQSALHFYDTKLGMPGIPPPAIPHVALDGYFRNGLLSVTLAKRSAWPEHHAYGLLVDEDSSNDLFAIVSNDGDVATWVKVVFTVTDKSGVPVPGTFETDPILLPAGAMYGDKKDARYKAEFVPPKLDKYYVSAECWADTDADTVPDTSMGKVKTFSFNVVETTED